MYIPSIAFEEMSGSDKGVTAAKMKNRKYIRNRGYGGSVRTADQAKVSGIKLVEEPTADAIDIRADYVAKYGAPSAAAPKIFFRYYYVNSSTGEKSGTILAECKWTPGT